MKNSKDSKSATKRRLEMVNFFYHHFVMNFNLKQTKKFFLTKKNFNNYQNSVLNFIFLNFDKIVDLISKNLNHNWSFSEISHFDKGVLVVIIGEFFVHQIPKKIAIAEAIKLIQKFSYLFAYTYIHKILDIILDKKNFSAPS